MSEFVDFNLSFSMDLADPTIQAWDGTAMPKIEPGYYVFETTNVEQVAQTNGGNAGVKFTFTVVSDHAGDEATPEKGKTLIKTYSLKQDPRVMGRWKNLLIALGQPLSGVSAGAMLGSRMFAEVVHREMPPQAKPDGSMTEAKVVQDLQGEQSLTAAGGSAADVAEEAPPPPPPPARKAVGGAVKANGAAKAVQR